MTIYRRGLKEQVKDELIRLGIVLESLDELQKEAIRINDNLFERAMEKRYNGGVTRSGTSGYRFGRNFDLNHRKKIFDPYSPMPMEIDTMKRKTMHRKPKKGQNKKILKYYSCGKPGYFAKDYRSKNMISRP